MCLILLTLSLEQKVSLYRNINKTPQCNIIPWSITSSQLSSQVQASHITQHLTTAVLSTRLGASHSSLHSPLSSRWQIHSFSPVLHSLGWSRCFLFSAFSDIDLGDSNTSLRWHISSHHWRCDLLKTENNSNSNCSFSLLKVTLHVPHSLSAGEKRRTPLGALDLLEIHVWF